MALILSPTYRKQIEHDQVLYESQLKEWQRIGKENPSRDAQNLVKLYSSILFIELAKIRDTLKKDDENIRRGLEVEARNERADALYKEQQKVHEMVAN